jgi:FkbM family methyltransferase
MRKSRIECLIDLLSVLAVRAEAKLARRHLRLGYAKLAIFAFDHIGSRVTAFGRYERDELDALAELLEDKKLIKGACLDIGANIGNHTVYFANLFREVHAFEPSPDPFALLQQNTRRLSNVQCHHIGLSNCQNRVTLFVPNDNIGAGSIQNHTKDVGASAVEISVVELDRFLSAHELDIGLMKIDVEGHELQVLEGSSATITRCQPAIVFEQQAQEIEAGRSKVINYLKGLGYNDFYEFQRTPAIPVRALNIVWRLLRGEAFGFQSISVLQRRFHGMLVALPCARTNS